MGDTNDQARTLLRRALFAQDEVTNYRPSRRGPSFREVMADNRKAWQAWKDFAAGVQAPDPWLATAIALTDKLGSGEVSRQELKAHLADEKGSA